jgi:hypothetical protein
MDMETDIFGRFQNSQVCDCGINSCLKMCCSVICRIIQFIVEGVIQMVIGDLKYHRCIEQSLRCVPVTFWTNLSYSRFCFVGSTEEQPEHMLCRHASPQKMCCLQISISSPWVLSHRVCSPYSKEQSWHLQTLSMPADLAIQTDF